MASLTYLWLGIIAGLAATPHCAGMCGAFPIHLSRTAGRGSPLVRQLLYLAGKTLTYAFFGALAGLAGHLVVESRLVSYSQQVLSYLVGAAMIVFGLAMLGISPSVRLALGSRQEWRFPWQLLGAFFNSPSPSASFLLGVGTGFLPCPITLALVAASAASHSVALGMLTMVGLGVGTSAVLLGIGLSGTLVDRRVRRIGLRGAGAIVVLIGVIVMLRPTGVLCRLLPHPGGFATLLTTDRQESP